LIQRILDELVATTPGARAAVFLDGEGETISQAGEGREEVRLLGAWKEIHLDHIRAITGRLGLGEVNAVFFSLDERNELLVPVTNEYCLLLLLSVYGTVADSMAGLRKAAESLRNEL
jgi:predicted regulator of Ras-like GTPase activity (Roadblock/LC7/MglB family)